MSWYVSLVNLTHYQTPNLRLFQTKRVCRRQFQIWRKWKKVIQTGRKHCGKRRNCSLRAISPFSTVFSKGLFQGASKGVIVWEWVKSYLNQGLSSQVRPDIETFTTRFRLLMILSKQPFLFFPGFFLPYQSYPFRCFWNVVCNCFQFEPV